MRLRALVTGACLGLSLSPLGMIRPMPVAAASPFYATSALQIARVCSTSSLASCQPDQEFSQGGDLTKSSSGETSLSVQGGRIAEARSYADLSTGKVGVYAKAQGPTLIDPFGRTRSDTEAIAIAQFKDRVTLHVSPTITGTFTARLHAVLTGSVTGLGTEPDLGFPLMVSANLDIDLHYHDDSGYYCESFCQHDFPAGHVTRSLHDGSFILDMDMPIHLNPDASSRINPTFDMTTTMNAGAQYFALNTSVGSGVQNAIYDFFNTGALSLQLPTGVGFTSDSGTFLSGVPAPSDTVAPTTTASLAPTANANGWNSTNVTVNLTSADNAGGSGVKEITSTLAGAQTGSAVTPGSTASVTVTQEGISTLTFFARDNVGNQEAPQTVTVRIDRTAPTVTGSRLPPANGYGWNNTDVTVNFACSDALSGIALCPSDVVLAGEGANQAATGSASDRAGNTASTTVGDINIDKTPPVTVASTNPPVNANGWNRGPVLITLAGSDALSGVLSTEFSLDGAGFLPYTAPVSVSGDGVHGLAFRSTDRAGNVEAAQSVAVKIDQTAPEAYFQFDPGANDISVFGRDAVSGLSQSGPLAPISVIQLGGDEEGDGHVGHGRGADRDSRLELRTYLVVDQAGNTLALTLGVSRQDKELSVRVVRLAYNGGPAVVPISNEAQFQADQGPSGALRRVEQEIGLESGNGDETVHAVWDARRDQTRITVERDDREKQIVRNGLVLLRLATSSGTLTIEF